MIWILIIITTTLLCLSLGFCFWVFQKYTDSQKKVILLTNQLIQNANKPILIGKIDKFSEKDIENLGKNREALEYVIKYVEYQICIKTDTIRNLHDGLDYKEKVGYVNALHSMNLFFWKIYNKKLETEEKPLQSLV